MTAARHPERSEGSGRRATRDGAVSASPPTQIPSLTLGMTEARNLPAQVSYPVNEGDRAMEIIVGLAGIAFVGAILVGLCAVAAVFVKVALFAITLPFKLLLLPLLLVFLAVKVALIVAFVGVVVAVIVPVAVLFLLIAAPFMVLAALT